MRLKKWRELLRAPVCIHGDAGLLAVQEDALAYLEEHLQSGMYTLETGAGASTVLFAEAGCRHICITPSQDEIDRLKSWCASHSVPTDQVTFLCAESEVALPKMEVSKLDVVLIDGRHGFPAPMIDWYYTTGPLVIGGLLALDDTQIWAVKVLMDFLIGSPEWQLCAHVKRTAFFRKLAEGSHCADWDSQSYVWKRSWPGKGGPRIWYRAQTAALLLRHGRVRLFIERVIHHVRRKG